MLEKIGVPNEIRTRVTAVKGPKLASHTVQRDCSILGNTGNQEIRRPALSHPVQPGMIPTRFL